LSIRQRHVEMTGLGRGKLPDKTIEFRTWFANLGQTFKSVDKQLSKKLKKRESCKIKQCYYNAWKCDIIGQMKYFEGFVLSKGCPIELEHSWLVKDGKVVDPTLCIGGRFGDEYFGIEIPRQWLNRHVMKTKTTGEFLVDYYLSLKEEVKK